MGRTGEEEDGDGVDGVEAEELRVAAIGVGATNTTSCGARGGGRGREVRQGGGRSERRRWGLRRRWWWWRTAMTSGCGPVGGSGDGGARGSGAPERRRRRARSSGQAAGRCPDPIGGKGRAAWGGEVGIDPDPDRIGRGGVGASGEWVRVTVVVVGGIGRGGLGQPGQLWPTGPLGPGERGSFLFVFYFFSILF